jgi:hypothetical protein
MGVELDVWAEHSINFDSHVGVKDFFESKTGKKITHRNRADKNRIIETRQIQDIQYFTDLEMLSQNFKMHKKIEVFTNFAFCRQINIYSKTLNFWAKGFYTRDTRWRELITKDFENKLHWNTELVVEFTNNWTQFRNYCKEMAQILGGEKIVYIRDNFNMIDKFFAGESLQSGVEHELATGIAEHYDFDLVEHFTNDFKNTYVWFYENLPNKND